MASYYFNLTHLTRTNGAPRASQEAAYILRQEREFNAQAKAYGWDTRRMSRQYGEDFVRGTYGNLPTWAHDNPITYFAAADEYERANGRIASILVVRLPRDLDRDAQWSILDTWAQVQYPRHPYVIAQHDTPAADGGSHPHAHILYSIRQTDAHDRGLRQHFARWNATQPEAGGAQKDPAFDAYGLVRAQRHTWSDVVNWHMERAGSTDFCDPRSLHVREIPRPPEPRLSAIESAQAKYRGRRSPRWDALQAQRVANQYTKPLEQQKAQEWWAYRREVVGAAGTTDVPTLITRLQANTAQEVRQFQPPVRERETTPTDPLGRHLDRVRTEIQTQAVARIHGVPLDGERIAQAHRLGLQTTQVLQGLARDAREQGIER